MQGPPGERFRVGRVIAQSFAIWARGLPRLLALVLVVHAPRVAAVETLERLWPSRLEAVLDAPFLTATRGFVVMLIDTLFAGLSVAPVVLAVYARLQGRDARVGESLTGSLRRFLPVLRVSLRLGAFSAALSWFALGAFLVSLRRLDDFAEYLLWALNIGWPLLIALLLSPFWVAVPAALVETEDRALRRSWSLTRSHRVGVCAILVLLLGIEIGSSHLLVRALPSDLPVLAWHTLGWTKTSLVVSLSAVFAAVCYHALRLEKEGVDVSKLEEIFA